MTETLQAPPPTDSHPPRRLTRSTRDKVIAGVCGGLGSYFHVDPVWFRVAFVALVLAGAGGGALLYLIAWIVIPAAEGDEPPAPASRLGSAAVVGVVLIATGALLLFSMAWPWLDGIVWPVLVILAGVAVFFGGGRRDHRS